MPCDLHSVFPFRLWDTFSYLEQFWSDQWNINHNILTHLFLSNKKFLPQWIRIWVLGWEDYFQISSGCCKSASDNNIGCVRCWQPIPVWQCSCTPPDPVTGWHDDPAKISRPINNSVKKVISTVTSCINCDWAFQGFTTKLRFYAHPRLGSLTFPPWETKWWEFME